MGTVPGQHDNKAQYDTMKGRGVPSRSKVAVRKCGGGNNGLVHDPHAVMLLVPLSDAAKDGDGFFCCRLAHNNLEHSKSDQPQNRSQVPPERGWQRITHGGKSALERTVLLDMFSVFGQSRRTDAAELSSSESGFQ